MKKQILLIIALLILFLGLFNGYNVKKPEKVYIYETNYTETIIQVDDLLISQAKALKMTKTPLRGNKSLNKNETINNYK